MSITSYVINNKPGNRAVQILVNANTAGSVTLPLANLCVNTASITESITDWTLSRVWWNGQWTISKGAVGATDVLYLTGASASAAGASWDFSMAGMPINSATGGPGAIGANLVISSVATGNASIIIEVVKQGSSYSPMAVAGA